MPSDDGRVYGINAGTTDHSQVNFRAAETVSLARIVPRGEQEVEQRVHDKIGTTDEM
jgi:hypothetical protein